MGIRLVARPFAFAFVLAACGGGGGGDDDAGVDAPPSPACLDATTYQELSTIETKIFKPSCVFSGCHNGAATPQGQMDMRETKAFAGIVNVDSNVSTGRKVVVPGDPESSYLMVMIGEIAPGDATPPAEPPPSTIGSMPQNAGSLLCNEKREAIRRWIMAGAQDN